MRMRVTAVRQSEMPIVSLMGDDLSGAALDRVREAIRVLEDACPRAAREVRRRLRKISIADIRAEPIVVLRRRMVLGDQYTRKISLHGLALVLVYGAVRNRLARYESRGATADRRAQIWRRVLREVAYVASVLDQNADPGAYIPGVSTGRLEQWTNAWLANAAVRLQSPRRSRWKLTRDLHRLGVPKWLRRPFVTFVMRRAAR